MVRSEVVHLSPEDLCPEVFANELHDVQFVLEARRVTSQSEHSSNLKRMLKTGKVVLRTPDVDVSLPLNESLTHPEAHPL